MSLWVIEQNPRSYAQIAYFGDSFFIVAAQSFYYTQFIAAIPVKLFFYFKISTW